MSWIELILLSISLAIDCFAISCVVGMLQPNLEKRYVWRFSLAFGIFQGGPDFFIVDEFLCLH